MKSFPISYGKHSFSYLKKKLHLKKKVDELCTQMELKQYIKALFCVELNLLCKSYVEGLISSSKRNDNIHSLNFSNFYSIHRD